MEESGILETTIAMLGKEEKEEEKKIILNETSKIQDNDKI